MHKPDARLVQVGLVAAAIILITAACAPRPHNFVIADIVDAHSRRPIFRMTAQESCTPEISRYMAEQSSALTVHGITDRVAADAALQIFTVKSDECTVSAIPDVELGFDQSFEVRWQPKDGAHVLMHHTVPNIIATDEPSVVLTGFHPADGVIPENIIFLRFQFSAPVVFDSSLYDKIRITDVDGKATDNPWFREKHRPSDVLEMRIHPGRVKSGLYDQYTGLAAAFTAGKIYYIEITGDFKDVYNRTVRVSGFRKALKVLPRDTKTPQVKSAAFLKTQNGHAVKVIFSETVRYQSALQSIRLLNSKEDAQPGKLSPDGTNEAVWLFTPKTPFAKGERYRVIISHETEDLAINQINRPFEHNAAQFANPDKSDIVIALPLVAK